MSENAEEDISSDTNSEMSMNVPQIPRWLMFPTTTVSEPPQSSPHWSFTYGPSQRLAPQPLHMMTYRPRPQPLQLMTNMIPPLSPIPMASSDSVYMQMPYQNPSPDTYQMRMPYRDPSPDTYQMRMPYQNPSPDTYQMRMPYRNPPPDTYQMRMPYRDPSPDTYQMRMPYRDPSPDTYQMQLQPMPRRCVQPIEIWQPARPEALQVQPIEIWEPAQTEALQVQPIEFWEPVRPGALLVQTSVLVEQHSWLTQHRNGRTVGPTEVLERGQGESRIRYCSTCNALWPTVGVPHTHAMTNECLVTKFFPRKCVPKFKCYMCVTEHRLEDIESHVATVHHDVGFDNDSESYVSYYCAKCFTVMYLPWIVFVRHRLKANCSPVKKYVHRDEPGEPLDITRQPTLLSIMRRLVRRFLKNGRENLLYACLVCKHIGTGARHPFLDCVTCSDPHSKFYCEHCNVVFSCLQLVYDIHRLTFEHFYLMHNRRVASNGFRPDGHGDDGGADRQGDDGGADRHGDDSGPEFAASNPGPSWAS